MSLDSNIISYVQLFRSSTKLPNKYAKDCNLKQFPIPSLFKNYCRKIAVITLCYFFPLWLFSWEAKLRKKCIIEVSWFSFPSQNMEWDPKDWRQWILLPGTGIVFTPFPPPCFLMSAEVNTEFFSVWLGWDLYWFIYLDHRGSDQTTW